MAMRTTPVVAGANQTGSAINLSGFAAGAVLTKGDILTFSATDSVNPLTYGVSALRQVLTGEHLGLGLSISVSASFAAVMFVLASYFARRR